MAISFNTYRGIKDLVYAPLTISASPEGVITEQYGEVKPLSGIIGIDVATEEGTDNVYADNGARIAIGYEGADTYTLTVTVLDLKTRAIIEGRTYDEAKKCLVGTPSKKGYFAIGYKAGTVGDDGEDAEEWSWILKGKFSGGNKSHNTKANNTDNSTVQYTFTSVYTATEFQLTGKKAPAKYVTIPSTHAGAATFFDTVTTPDKVSAGA